MKSKLNSRKVLIFTMLMLVTYSFSISYWHQRGQLYWNGQIALPPDGKMAAVLFILIPILVAIAYLWLPSVYKKHKKSGFKIGKNQSKM